MPSYHPRSTSHVLIGKSIHILEGLPCYQKRSHMCHLPPAVCDILGNGKLLDPLLTACGHVVSLAL